MLERIHRLIFALGVLLAGYPFLYYVVTPRFFQRTSVEFNPWAAPIYFPEKSNELVAYIGSTALLFCYFIFSMLLIRILGSRWTGGFRLPIWQSVAGLIVGLALNLFPLTATYTLSTSAVVYIVPAVLWILLFAYPLWAVQFWRRVPLPSVGFVSWGGRRLRALDRLLLIDPSHLEFAYRTTFGIGILTIGYPFMFYAAASRLPDIFLESGNRIFAATSTLGLLVCYVSLMSLFVSLNRGRWVAQFEFTSPWRLLGTFGAALAVNILPFFMDHTFERSARIFLIPMLLWIVFLLQPFWKELAGTREQEESSRSRILVLKPLIVICVLQVFFMFSPFIAGKLMMINEFLDVPQDTLLNTGVVRNSVYLNSRNLLGLYKYDAVAKAVPFNGTARIEFPYSSGLQEFINLGNPKFSYDQQLGELSINGVFSDDEYTALTSRLSGQEEQGLAGSFRIEALRNEETSRPEYSATDLEFLRKNQHELTWQILSRWVIHHHNFVLGPINEYALGKPLEEIYAQYGRLNIVLMNFILARVGGVSFQNYFKVWYSFYWIYYVIFLAVLFVVLQNTKLVFLVFAGSLTILNFIGYQALFLAPGLNPIRHFFDLFIVCCLYYYVARKRVEYLLLTAVFVLLSVLNNYQVGLCGLAAVIAVVLLLELDGFIDGRLLRWGVVLGTTALSFLLVKWSTSGFDPAFSYYVSGLSGYPLGKSWLCMALAGSVIAYWLLFSWDFKSAPMKYLAMFMIVYAQTMFVYCVWGGTTFHVLNLGNVFMLTSGVFLKLLADQLRPMEVLPGIGALIAVTLLPFSTMSFYRGKNEYAEIFSTHPAFSWKMDRASFLSTMNPEIFDGSVRLIQKYASNSPRIHIISKYDYFLPFLAEKYSAMPFFDLAWFQLTRKEVERSVETVRRDRPEFLFVDADIDRPLNTEIIRATSPSPFGELRQESIQRVGRISEIRKVFEAVRGEYEIVESGHLLSVYRRKVQ